MISREMACSSGQGEKGGKELAWSQRPTTYQSHRLGSSAEDSVGGRLHRRGPETCVDSASGRFAERVKALVMERSPTVPSLGVHLCGWHHGALEVNSSFPVRELHRRAAERPVEQVPEEPVPSTGPCALVLESFPGRQPSWESLSL